MEDCAISAALLISKNFLLLSSSTNARLKSDLGAEPTGFVKLPSESLDSTIKGLNFGFEISKKTPSSPCGSLPY